MKRIKLFPAVLIAAAVFLAPSCELVRVFFEFAPAVYDVAQAVSPDAKEAKPSDPKGGKETTPPKGGTTAGTAAGTSSGASSGTAYTSAQLSSVQSTIIAAAKSKIGSKYSYGATGPDKFDCSGFIYYSFQQAGITLPRTSVAQYNDGKIISKDELMPCDLIFFSGSKISSTVGHVGMVLSYDKSTGTITFIHTSSSKGVEIQKSTTDYYAKRYIGIRRVL